MILAKYEILQKYNIDIKDILLENLERPIVKGITIDADNTIFSDDGISFYKKNNYYILKVSVTDITEVINYNSKFDLIARKKIKQKNENRLFPLNVSHSIKMEEKNLTLSITVELKFDKFFNLIDRKIYKSVFYSQRHFSFSEIDEILNSEYKIKKNNNIKQLSLFIQNYYYKKNNNNNVIVFDASNIVKEIMILINSEVANYCYKNSIPIIYETKNFIDKYTIKKTNYTTFTSPLRRYVDIIIQSQIKVFLNKKQKGLDIKYNYTLEFLTEYTKTLNIDNNITNPREIIKKEIKEKIKQKQKINNELINLIKEETEKNRIDIFSIFYIIFYIRIDINTKKYFISKLRKNIIKDWHKTLYYFISAKTNILINKSKKYNYQNNYIKLKKSDINNQIIFIKIDNQLFSFSERKKSGLDIDKSMLRILNKIHKYICQNNFDIFE